MSRDEHESEESIEGGLQGTGVALDLREEKSALKGREQGHGEVIGVDAGQQMAVGVQRSQCPR